MVPPSIPGLYDEVSMKNNLSYLRGTRKVPSSRPLILPHWMVAKARLFLNGWHWFFAPYSSSGVLYLLLPFTREIALKHCSLYVVLPACCPTVSPVKALIWHFKHSYITLHLQSSVHALIKLHA